MTRRIDRSLMYDARVASTCTFSIERESVVASGERAAGNCAIRNDGYISADIDRFQVRPIASCRPTK